MRARLLLSGITLCSAGIGSVITTYTLDFGASTFQLAERVARDVEYRRPDSRGPGYQVHQLVWGTLPVGTRIVTVEDDYTRGRIKIGSERRSADIVEEGGRAVVRWHLRTRCDEASEDRITMRVLMMTRGPCFRVVELRPAY